jgi:hypothetical protein
MNFNQFKNNRSIKTETVTTQFILFFSKQKKLGALVIDHLSASSFSLGCVFPEPEKKYSCRTKIDIFFYNKTKISLKTTV